jgi:hypothetical protein
MFLRVVETIVTQEVEIDRKLYDDGEGFEGNGLSDARQEELFDVHGEPLFGKSD